MIRIEHLNDGHLPLVAALHRRIFKSRVSADDLKWKYSAEHTGADHGCFVAMEGDSAVAFHGGLPQIFELEGRSVLVGQSCDSMASPLVKGKGVYGDLLKRTEEHMLGNGAALLYGAANESSRRAMQRSGWRAVGPALSRFSVEVPTAPVARAVWRVPFLRPWLGRRIRAGFASDHSPLDEFTNSLAGPDLLVQRYSPALFRYKARNGGFGVRLGGARAWLKAAPDLSVGDLLVPDAASLKLFLAGLVSRAKALGVAAVHAYAFPGTPIDEMLGEVLSRQSGQHILVSPGTPTEMAQRLRVGLADIDIF